MAPAAARRVVLAAALSLAGCAAPAGEPEWDPWEGFNRRIFWFNERVDEYALEPASRGWEAVTTPGLRRSVADFTSNLLSPRHLVNNLLQGRLADAAATTARFALNTTLGLLGFFDPATHFGLEARPADFGGTLAAWGVEAGPYLVLPFFGPSNPRDTGGLAVDGTIQASMEPQDNVFVVTFAVGLVNWRALHAADIAEAREASFDYYAAVRSAWLAQRRRELGKEGAADGPEPGLPSPAQEDPYDVEAAIDS